MRRTKLNRLILLMLAAGIFLTLAVNAAVGNARRRNAEARETAAAEAAMDMETGNPPEAETVENYGPGFQKRKPAAGSTAADSPSDNVQGTIGPGGYATQNPGSYEDFLRKFSETEETIERMNTSGKKNQSEVERRNAASSQLRYWETQMNSVYQTIMSVISTEEAAVLSRDQQDWKKQREKEAAEAARSSAGSRYESTEYTLSQAEATRKRAYELLERYRDRL